MLDKFVAWLSEKNPQTESENMVIRYGVELLLENILKILLLLGAGLLWGKGLETIIYLSVFCSIRTQAGGYHAKTGWGCCLCMLLVWMIGMVTFEIIEVSLLEIFILFIFAVIIILWKVPKTVNRDCYTLLEQKEKKKNAVVLLYISIIVAICCKEWRTLVTCAVALEIITLLPE